MASVLRATVAVACPCAVSAGPSAPLTAPTETLAVAVGVSILRETGTWDVGSIAHGEPAGVRTDRVLLDVALAWRPTPRVEASVQLGASSVLADAPGDAIRGRALGDATFRARWDLRDADAPGPWPGFGLTAALRAPTGSAGSRETSVSEVADLGLGTWEFAAGFDLRRSLGPVWTLGVATEGALRLPDDSTGTSRTLGPRVTAAVSAMYRPTDDLALSLAVGEWWEGSTQLDGQTAPDSSLRRTTVSLGLTTRTTALRWTALVAFDPGIDGLGTNAVTTLRVGVLAAWIR